MRILLADDIDVIRQGVAEKIKQIRIIPVKISGTYERI